MTKYVGSIDQGTTSSRFIIFDRKGTVIAVDQKEHEQIFPKPAWVEQNAIQSWANTMRVVGHARGEVGRAGEFHEVRR